MRFSTKTKKSSTKANLIAKVKWHKAEAAAAQKKLDALEKAEAKAEGKEAKATDKPKR